MNMIAIWTQCCQ